MGNKTFVKKNVHLLKGDSAEQNILKHSNLKILFKKLKPNENVDVINQH